jgi:Tol biopolymer transport system component
MPRTPRFSRLFALVALGPLALVISACLPQGVRVPQSEFSAMLERKVGLIAYLGTDGNIYTIDQGGGNETPITSDARSSDTTYHIYGLPAWSRDGQSIAFPAYTGRRDQQAPDTTSLYTARRDGSDLVEAHSSDDFLVFWSWAPDNRRVGFIAESNGNTLAFKVVPSEGGEAQVVDAGAPYYWAWAPNSNAVLAHAGGASPSASARLSLLQLEDAIYEQVLDIPPAEFKSPAFSPDGSQVLVAGVTGDGADALLLTDALGSDPRVLAEYNGTIAFAWSPNGQRVAYLESASPELGTPGRLVIVDPSGRREPVELEGTDVYAFFWSPDSKSLAYFSEAEIEELQTQEAENGTAGEVPTAGDVLVFDLNVMNAGNGRTHNVATFVPTERFMQVIPYFDQYHQALTVWSPDSKNLVVSAYAGEDTPAIFVVAASGRLEPRYIANGWMAFWSWE